MSVVARGVMVLWLSACATAPPMPVQPPVVTWPQKLTWILRLEDQRLLRDPNPLDPVILVPAGRNQPAIVAPPAPSDLIRLLADSEARVRRRAALAAGRVRLVEAVEPLTRLLVDEDAEVRQMAAFALGLIAPPTARPALLTALDDPQPIVQGRAAEALGLIADRADAPAVAAMVRRQIAAGALRDVAADDVRHPFAPPAEAVRLGLSALVRLGSYEALASAVLDDRGQPVSQWWPVAWALQRISDPRAEAPLGRLLVTPGRYTAALAARGLGSLRAQSAAFSLRQIVEAQSADRAVIIQAIRALGTLRDQAAAAGLGRLVTATSDDSVLQLEAVTALGAIASADSLDLMLDLVSDRSASLRAAAMQALARIDPDAFVLTLSGLDPDPNWLVRAAQATALGTLPADRAGARLIMMANDRDPRVLPAVLAALASSKSPDAERVLLDQLRNDDFAVRAAAARGLAQLGAAGAAPALIQAYRGAVGDSTYVARAAALDALNQLDRALAGPILQEALKDREWAVRTKAASLLGAEVTTSQAAIRPASASRGVTDPAWQPLVNPQFSPHAFIDTDRGTVEIELAIADAPLTVANFITLAAKGFYNGLAIHRVVPDFVVQAGDPRGDSEGGPGYTIRDERNERPYLRGTVGMALDWEDTGGSQFFVTLSPQPQLDARYTAFGEVVSGMDVVDQLVPGDVIRRVRIWDGVTMTR